MDDIVLKNICGWIGAALLLFFFISPIVPILQVFKNETLIKDVPGWLFLSSLLDSLFWGGYSFYINELPSIVPNLIGIVVLTILMTVYWILYSECALVKSLIINGVMYVVIGLIAVGLYFISFEEWRDVIGYIAAAINIVMMASPGQKIIQVFKTGNYELIAIVSSVCAFFCGGFWLIFGIIISNVSICASNGTGFVFATFQLVIYITFRCKAKNRDYKSSELVMSDKETH